VSRAQDFLADMEGRGETIENEPEIYRHTEVSGDGFKAFELRSLLPKTGFDVQIAKMAESENGGWGSEVNGRSRDQSGDAEFRRLSPGSCLPFFNFPAAIPKVLPTPATTQYERIFACPIPELAFEFLPG